MGFQNIIGVLIFWCRCVPIANCQVAFHPGRWRPGGENKILHALFFQFHIIIKIEGTSVKGRQVQHIGIIIVIAPFNLIGYESNPHSGSPQVSRIKIDPIVFSFKLKGAKTMNFLVQGVPLDHDIYRSDIFHDRHFKSPGFAFGIFSAYGCSDDRFTGFVCFRIHFDDSAVAGKFKNFRNRNNRCIAAGQGQFRCIIIFQP